MEPLVKPFMHPQWLSNSWVIGDPENHDAILIDAGGPKAKVLEFLHLRELQLRALFLTHHHYDHVHDALFYQKSFEIPVYLHALERNLVHLQTELLQGGESIEMGRLTIKAVHIPGHTLGQLGFSINEKYFATGDTLFRESVAGTLGKGHTTFEDLRDSIFHKILVNPERTLLLPGHGAQTTVEHEKKFNPFVKSFALKDPKPVAKCLVHHREADLFLEARDYDGGTKCWIQFCDSSEFAVAPGSSVQDLVRIRKC